jgi:hypothetical protein
MKYLSVVLMLCAECSFAQTPGPLYRTDSSRNRNTDIRERLVQLALQNPQYEMADHASGADSYQIYFAYSAFVGVL